MENRGKNVYQEKTLSTEVEIFLSKKLWNTKKNWFDLKTAKNSTLGDLLNSK